MNAEIDESGKLLIRPTTQTEEAALKAWIKTAFIKQINFSLNEDGYWRGSLVVPIRFKGGKDE